EAPDFSLQASTGQSITLSSLKGSYVVLIFYPANDTPTCNSQLDDMSLNLNRFLEHNARVFGINTASAEKHREYCSRRRLEFPILSDPGGKTAKSYKSWWQWFACNQRTVVVIDPQGKICLFERGKPEPDSILQAITGKNDHPNG
ncbi:MAG TPA: peroxiredoxin, partial [Chroococcales cyanobacterium]